MNEGSEILLQNPIHDFGLTIRLWMVSRAHTESRSTESEKLTPEGAEEDWVSVGDNTSREAVMFTDDIDEQGGDLEG